MAKFPLAEIVDAYETFKVVSDECCVSSDYNAFADLFTEDCVYVEHGFGVMHGRDAVRAWIVPLMGGDSSSNIVRYTHDWVLFDEANDRVVFCARSHMADPGDGSEHSATNWTSIDYAGNGLWSREEDIYNPATFVTLITEWQAARDAAETANA